VTQVGCVRSPSIVFLSAPWAVPECSSNPVVILSDAEVGRHWTSRTVDMAGCLSSVHQIEATSFPGGSVIVQDAT
jgi:hypothetical protein